MNTPPTVAATNTVTAHNIAEILIVLGVTRMSVEMTAGGVRYGGVPEFFQTISLSPMAAQQLHQRLTATLTAYVLAYGAIPADPDFSPQAGESVQ
jgi:hypothetical protein